MAKFQLCEFRRTKPTGMFKADPENKYERGIACVKEYGWEIEYILDDEGDKVKTVHDYRLLKVWGGGVIDTKEESIFY